MTTKTRVEIRGDQFLINGAPTYRGVTWRGQRIEGLLLNARLVQGVFDDLNPDTRHLWAYPDGGEWDAERNTDAFIAAMPSWAAHGILAFTLNLQGGSPYGYSKEQPWINSAFEPDGTLRDDYLARLTRVLDAADGLGLVVILGCFYFGQEKVMADEAAIIRAVENIVAWLLERGRGNVLLEINNECDIRYQQPILMPGRVHELILRAKEIERDGARLLAGTSFGGRSVPNSTVVTASDFLLLHGNSVKEPDGIRDQVRRTRAVEGYRPMPILYNEDDHFRFDEPDNNFVAAIGEYASWGLFDYRLEGEDFDHGYQSVPANWEISSSRKHGFFDLAKRISRGED